MNSDINKIASYLGVNPLLVAREMVEPKILVGKISTLSAALNVYENSVKGTELAEEIEQKITQIGEQLLKVANFEEVHRIWHIAPENSRLQELADERMAQMYKAKLEISNIEEAEKISILAPEGCKLKKQACHKIIELKKQSLLSADYETARMIWEGETDKKLREIATTRMTELKNKELSSATYEEAADIKRAAFFMKNKPLENLAIAKMIELVKRDQNGFTFEEARTIWDDAVNNEELRTLALEIMNTAGELALESIVINNIKNIWKYAPYPQAAELRKKALNRLLQLI